MENDSVSHHLCGSASLCSEECEIEVSAISCFHVADCVWRESPPLRICSDHRDRKWTGVRIDTEPQTLTMFDIIT